MLRLLRHGGIIGNRDRAMNDSAYTALGQTVMSSSLCVDGDRLSASGLVGLADDDKAEHPFVFSRNVWWAC